MPTIQDVYEKFGEAAEAAQLLETELGTALMLVTGTEEGLLTGSDPARASDLLDAINRRTFGQLLRNLGSKTQSRGELESLLSKALEERNRLFHSFYREHNFRRNSDEGRAIMLKDLETIHERLLAAYKAVMLASGVDLDAPVQFTPPTGHLPI